MNSDSRPQSQAEVYAAPAGVALEQNAVLRNTYRLLSMTLFVSVFNLFTSQLHIFGILGGEE